ncbi:protease modulator HflC [Lysinibacillus sphaericus]|uniref:Protein HflC n=2 Tax=Lysinibacillus TaxID=400634 RepID=A0A2S0JY66_LYSSH|nr:MULTISPECIES: protease modulator HflC [Lysinibacillus]AVK95914.1 protease modulator HflC [Lysinibacillus sphaericus]MCS1380691.1 protease modulator HflC [Lysinibacillus sphaericus]MED4544992.1 protease modulator HflC [Lysinibacillus sphaericus]TKI21648.1 protease modulator HflC [Lysinibacillus sphaericus]TKI49781.1 protease modulator HflC [Lysinibacillus tabacifolii]
MDQKNKDLEKFLNFLSGKSKNTAPSDGDNVIKMSKKGPLNPKKYISLVVTLTVVFAIAIILFANVYIVKESEYAVVRQFGEVVKFERDPGLKMKVPFIQSVTTLPKNQMTYNISEEEINTKDKKRIIIDNYAVWRITDPKALISNAGTLTKAESRMEEFIYSVIRTELGQLKYDEIINDENSSRGSLNDRVTARVNELLLNDKYGIEVVDVRIRRTDLPAENEQSVFTRMVSERQSTAQLYLSEGDADKRRIEAQTDREVQEMLATANKEAALIQAEGEAEAAKIYNSSFSKDPEFYSLYRTLESYKKTVGEDTVIILPSTSPYAKVLSGYIK